MQEAVPRFTGLEGKQKDNRLIIFKQRQAEKSSNGAKVSSNRIFVSRTMVLDKEDNGKPKGCAGCKRGIKDRFMLQAVDRYWHEDCLKCACCDCRLGEEGSTLYTRANLILCRRDYLRLFGSTGNCAACSKLIPAFEMVMRAKENVYHLDCFACQLCRQRFCVGDKFFFKDNMILCQMDYEGGTWQGNYEKDVQ